MRSEEEMLQLITETARKDPRIRAAYIEGSRANPNVPRDMFQDYDIEYIVMETKSFREDRPWIDRFGARLYMQYPDEHSGGNSDVENWYGWLIQFVDGNRLDLHVCTKDYALHHLELYRTLVDKDGILPKFQEDSDERYWIKRPQQGEFLDTCNEFWWCLNNVAKGLWRGELPYVMDAMDFQIRPMLKRLLEWSIASENDFSVSVGKAGKYMKNYLPEKTYNQFLATYPVAEKKAAWDAVFIMCDLFQTTAGELGRTLGFACDYAEAENSRRYLEHIRALPAGAKEIPKIKMQEWI